MLDPDFASSSTLVSSADPSSFIETDVRIRIRVATEYREYGCYTPSTSSQAPSANEDYVPLYEFDMNDIATVLQDTSTLSTPIPALPINLKLSSKISIISESILVALLIITA